MALDLFSTSQTWASYLERFLNNGKGEETAKKLLRQGELEQKGEGAAKCRYHAPYFAYETERRSWNVKVGCCNHWDCPKCGITRAKVEYHRIVSGCSEIVQQGHSLWFITITARGKSLKVEEAEKQYLQWTNRLLTNLRQQARRQNTHWCYVQVTERQKRRMPHSHILTTYHPLDIFDDGGELFEGVIERWEMTNEGRKPYYASAIRSDVLQAAVCSSGLGEQYDISRVREPDAVSRYVGKYLFKHSLHTAWPKGWKRVRYSHNWPKQDLPKTDAIALIKQEDWLNLAARTDKVRCPDEETARRVMDYMYGMGVHVSYNKTSTVC